MRRIIPLALLSPLLFVCVAPSYAAADEAQSLFCAQFSSSSEYVRQSIAVCLEDVPSRRTQCMRDAEEQFSLCGFKGNFRRISNRVQSKIIMLSFFKNLVAPKQSALGLAKR